MCAEIDEVREISLRRQEELEQMAMYPTLFSDSRGVDPKQTLTVMIPNQKLKEAGFRKEYYVVNGKAPVGSMEEAMSKFNAYPRTTGLMVNITRREYDASFLEELYRGEIR